MNNQVQLRNITQPDTFLEDYNIELIKSMFKDEQRYMYYMKMLWTLRSMVVRNIKDFGTDEGMSDPQFPIYKLLNDLIGSLLNRDIPPCEYEKFNSIILIWRH